MLQYTSNDLKLASKLCCPHRDSCRSCACCTRVHPMHNCHHILVNNFFIVFSQQSGREESSLANSYSNFSNNIIHQNPLLLPVPGGGYSRVPVGGYRRGGYGQRTGLASTHAITYIFVRPTLVMFVNSRLKKFICGFDGNNISNGSYLCSIMIDYQRHC